MNFRKITGFFSIAFFVVISAATAQPFANDIAAFKKADSISFPAKGQVLFVGSSSFTKWKDVQQYFPAYPIINRGFGGSSLPDVIRYAPDIIYPYHPKQVVIYCGENDFASSDTVTAEMVTGRFKTLFNMIRENLPGVPIAFVSIKPSPSREHLWTKMIASNKAIRKFLKKKKKAAYIDVYTKMFNADGTVMADIFIGDRLHMNAKGYAIWQKAIEPYLVK
ncbi:GDSL-type esterase/lipase family protein [Ferruginibacter sp. HRS2-29]|uniref:GDSL-type esterase/lipase family protein n=1 Tax=Ferruginibacter sp. HRS2-29 TaxID=2487334 RepID=UPI0020CBC27B|nr:GDSL-type esterase/lipase family protein [Ferruginibacter sp. HRS2-29]MCP9749712.1 G-D-S-L family lipolytic protein [Ferruginibacter sp. HRS2-29]